MKNLIKGLPYGDSVILPVARYLVPIHILLLTKIINPLVSLFSPKRLQKNILYAFYDKRVSPTTFDFVTFLILAELARIRAGCTFMHVIFVGYHDEQGLNDEANEFNEIHKSKKRVDTDFIRWRLQNILLPCCSFMGSCNAVSVCASYEEAQSIEMNIAYHKFPESYSVATPVNRTAYRYIKRELLNSNGMEAPAISATSQSLNIVDDWIRKHCGQRKVVTITLREAQYNTIRNSKIAEWARFVAGMDKNVYCPVIVRDTYCDSKLPKEFDDCIIHENASWNTFIRMALYQLSYINLSVSNGTVSLYMFCRESRYLVFKVVADSHVSSTKFLEEVHGIKSGEQPFIRYHEFQKFIWEDDDFDVINREFNKMCYEIESTEALRSRQLM